MCSATEIIANALKTSIQHHMLKKLDSSLNSIQEAKFRLLCFGQHEVDSTLKLSFIPVRSVLGTYI